MEYNKQDIFPLYVGKCEVKAVSQDFTSGSSTGKLTAIFTQTNEIEFVSQGCDYIVPLSDCSLILKPISGMSDKDRLEYMATKDMLCDSGDTLANWVKYVDTYKTFLWLITNGFALSDNWFTGDSPIAVKQTA